MMESSSDPTPVIKRLVTIVGDLNREFGSAENEEVMEQEPRFRAVARFTRIVQVACHNYLEEVGEA